jgi:hypothetical protein
MTVEQVRSVVQEFFACRPAAASGEAAQAEAALFVEQVFAISLEDAEISEETLGSAQAMIAFVAARLGAR